MKLKQIQLIVSEEAYCQKKLLHIKCISHYDL
jgi:hypothetical protein